MFLSKCLNRKYFLIFLMRLVVIFLFVLLVPAVSAVEIGEKVQVGNFVVLEFRDVRTETVVNDILLAEFLCKPGNVNVPYMVGGGSVAIAFASDVEGLTTKAVRDAVETAVGSSWLKGKEFSFDFEGDVNYERHWYAVGEKSIIVEGFIIDTHRGGRRVGKLPLGVVGRFSMRFPEAVDIREEEFACPMPVEGQFVLNDAQHVLKGGTQGQHGGEVVVQVSEYVDEAAVDIPATPVDSFLSVFQIIELDVLPVTSGVFAGENVVFRFAGDVVEELRVGFDDYGTVERVGLSEKPTISVTLPGTFIEKLVESETPRTDFVNAWDDGTIEVEGLTFGKKLGLFFHRLFGGFDAGSVVIEEV
jgi:hypothetical protein